MSSIFPNTEIARQAIAGRSAMIEKDGRFVQTSVPTSTSIPKRDHTGGAEIAPEASSVQTNIVQAENSFSLVSDPAPKTPPKGRSKKNDPKLMELPYVEVKYVLPSVGTITARANTFAIEGTVLQILTPIGGLAIQPDRNTSLKIEIRGQVYDVISSGVHVPFKDLGFSSSIYFIL